MSAIKPKDRTIRLIVEAEQLYNSDGGDANLDKFSSLVDDEGFGNAFGEPNANFETIVFMNKKGCWSIEKASNEGENQYYSVSLSKVIHKPNADNPQFFTKDPLEVNPGTGTVCGTIAKNPNLPEKDDSYSIEFYVGFRKKTEQGGVVSGMVKFTLDPKLKIRSRD